MIHWLIAGAGLALVTLTCHAWLDGRRRRRARNDFRHLTGAPEWWGKR